MRIVNGWHLYEFQSFKDQKAKLEAAVEARKAAEPESWQSSADAKLLTTIQNLTQSIIPANPGAKQFRQGDTLGAARKHWFRAKFGNGRYRLFFQFNSAAKIIIYAWVNDVETLRTYGARTDAYSVFRSMLAKGNPPNTWDELARAVGAKDKLPAQPKNAARKPGAKGVKRKR